MRQVQSEIRRLSSLQSEEFV
mgnify:CR=1